MFIFLLLQACAALRHFSKPVTSCVCENESTRLYGILQALRRSHFLAKSKTPTRVQSRVGPPRLGNKDPRGTVSLLVKIKFSTKPAAMLSIKVTK